MDIRQFDKKTLAALGAAAIASTMLVGFLAQPTFDYEVMAKNESPTSLVASSSSINAAGNVMADARKEMVKLLSKNTPESLQQAMLLNQRVQSYMAHNDGPSNIYQAALIQHAVTEKHLGGDHTQIVNALTTKATTHIDSLQKVIKMGADDEGYGVPRANITHYANLLTALCTLTGNTSDAAKYVVQYKDAITHLTGVTATHGSGDARWSGDSAKYLNTVVAEECIPTSSGSLPVMGM